MSTSSSDIMLCAAKLEIKAGLKRSESVENSCNLNGELFAAASKRASESMDSAALHVPASASSVSKVNPLTRCPLLCIQDAKPATVSRDADPLTTNITCMQGSQKAIAALQAFESCMALQAVRGSARRACSKTRGSTSVSSACEVGASAHQLSTIR